MIQYKDCTMANQLSLKLLIDTKSRRVLFAEASKDFVDFLFSLLSIPMGSIVKLLAKEQMVGSIGSIYKSVENLDETYIASNEAKNIILNPTYNSHSKSDSFLTDSSSTTSTTGKYYRCNNSCRNYYTDVRCTSCPGCRGQMTLELRYVGAPKTGKVVDEAAGCDAGVVKGVVTYTVMDDLTVTPMSTISSITMLNKFNVKDVSSLEERRVKLGINKGLKLLKASLKSKHVFTRVFLGMKSEPMR